MEAEENRLRQKQEILQMLDGDMLELNKMKDQVLLLVGKQKKIKKIRRKRRQLPTILEEDGEEEGEEDADLSDLMSRTSSLLSNIDDNENKILALKSDVDGEEDLMSEVRSLEDDIIKQSKTVEELTQATNKLYYDEDKLLQQKLLKDQEMEQRKGAAEQNLLDIKDKYGNLITATAKIIEQQRDVGEIYRHLDSGPTLSEELELLLRETLQYEQSVLDILSSTQLIG